MKYHIIVWIIAFGVSTLDACADTLITRQAVSVSLTQVVLQENGANISYSIINNLDEGIRFFPPSFNYVLLRLAINIDGNIFITQALPPHDYKLFLSSQRESLKQFPSVLSPLQRKEFSVQWYKLISVDMAKGGTLKKNGDYVLDGVCHVTNMQGEPLAGYVIAMGNTKVLRAKEPPENAPDGMKMDIKNGPAGNLRELLSASITRLTFQDDTIIVTFSLVNKSDETIRLSKNNIENMDSTMNDLIYNVIININGNICAFGGGPAIANFRSLGETLAQRFPYSISPEQKIEFSVPRHDIDLNLIAENRTNIPPLTKSGDYMINGLYSIIDKDVREISIRKWNVFGSGRVKIEGKPNKIEKPKVEAKRP